MADDLVGHASIIDGETLEIRGNRIRLWGVDAPEGTQRCRGEDSLQYPSGNEAANDLYDFIAHHLVNCSPLNLDQYGRAIATCSVGRIDIREWLVRNGLALDWPRYSRAKYRAVQQEAAQAGLGIWKGSYDEPWLYRVYIRSGGRPAACSDDASAHP